MGKRCVHSMHITVHPASCPAVSTRLPLAGQHCTRRCLALQSSAQLNCGPRKSAAEIWQPCYSTRRCRMAPRGSPVAQSTQAPERVDATATASPSDRSLSARDVNISLNGSSTTRSADERLPLYSPAMGKVELVIAGAGPSGLAVADRVSQAGKRFLDIDLSRSYACMHACWWPVLMRLCLHAGFRVCIIDPNPHAAWPNNYGAALLHSCRA